MMQSDGAHQRPRFTAARGFSSSSRNPSPSLPRGNIDASPAHARVGVRRCQSENIHQGDRAPLSAQIPRRRVFSMWGAGGAVIHLNRERATKRRVRSL